MPKAQDKLDTAILNTIAELKQLNEAGFPGHWQKAWENGTPVDRMMDLVVRILRTQVHACY